MAAQAMKLAEALLIRADLQTRFVQLQGRIKSNAVVQKGDKPQENPAVLLREATGVLSELQELVTRINRTNQVAKLPDGRTMMEAIAERDRLKKHHSLLLAADDAMKRTPESYGLREVKWVPQMESAKLQKQAEDIAKQIRGVNARIQETNWNTKLEP